MHTLSDKNIQFNSVNNVQDRHKQTLGVHHLSHCLIAIAKTINNSPLVDHGIKEILREMRDHLAYEFLGIAIKQPNLPYLKFSNLHPNKEFTEGIFSVFPAHAIIKSCYLNREKISTRFIPDEFRFKNSNLTLTAYPILFDHEFQGIIYAGTRIKQQTDILETIASLVSSYLKARNLTSNVLNDVQVDAITGLYTNAVFNERLLQEIKRYDRIGSPVSVILIDIHKLRSINDQHGYEAGNQCLKDVGKAVQESIRSIDLPARYGGDEIIVLLPETNKDNANFVGNRIAKAISKITMVSGQRIVVGIGIATLPDVTSDPDHLITIADQALYLAKKEGKNATKVVNAGYISTDENLLPDTIKKIIQTENQKLNDQFMSHINKCVNLKPNELYKPYVQGVILSIAGTIDAKDKCTRGHSQAVSFFSRDLAQAMGMTSREIEIIRLGGLLHDVGKIGIPESILSKPGPLNDNEWSVMKQHPTIGAEKILKHITAFDEIIPIVALHHERWDGSGYPHGLKKNNIPLTARIVAVVDSFHTMISARPYKKALSVKEAIKIIDDGAGTFWDPDITKLFVTNITKSLKKAI